ncbi:VOC family protein [Filimonas effusa]|uniref:VOC family protein n=1 Tax=Filimonas effusa TaxID=2508721 RepID=A0A4Q1D5R9_9BACT|nr:VOC family protein [Filimonas effusa]RXK83902.1 VOC family protein [Filimonas effusa]
MNNSIYPCLTIKGKIAEAAALYADVFGAKTVQSSPIVNILEIDGQKLMLLNDGPTSKPNPAISFMFSNEHKEATEACWNKLTEGGKVLMPLDSYPWSSYYGWVEDKYGVNWQLITNKEELPIQRFSPTLMFVGDNAGKAAAAISFYTQLFPQSNVRGILKYGEGEGDNTDYIKHAQFSVNGYVMMAMDSSHAHHFTFVDAVSLVAACNTQEEIDRYWETLTSEGGKEIACGWLVDKYGVSWQIVPANLGALMSKGGEKAQRVMSALLKMKKLVIKDLENA